MSTVGKVMGGDLRAFRRWLGRVSRFRKVWRPFTSTAGEQAQRDRTSKVQLEVDDLKGELGARTNEQQAEDLG